MLTKEKVEIHARVVHAIFPVSLKCVLNSKPPVQLSGFWKGKGALLLPSHPRPKRTEGGVNGARHSPSIASWLLKGGVVGEFFHYSTLIPVSLSKLVSSVYSADGIKIFIKAFVNDMIKSL